MACVNARSPIAQMEEERREHVAKMKKMEMEMEQVFEMKVKEKIQKLRDSEAEVLTTPQFPKMCNSSACPQMDWVIKRNKLYFCILYFNSII